ncbi:MAG TPA: cytochrome c-type biogenesis protein CcmH [Candidatus Acidoferrum sp.]|jgi:cytochrome c-type biogenesis protein CcmH
MTKRRLFVATMVFSLAASLPFLFSPLSAQQQNDRARQIGGKFMCMCSCNQVLTQCNHVGCTTSTAMLKQIDQSLAQGDSEDAITQAFVQQFGTKVYAEPPHSGFSLIAWSMPAVYLAVGLALVLFVISRWRKRPAHSVADVARPRGISAEVLERARAQAARETQD